MPCMWALVHVRSSIGPAPAMHNYPNIAEFDVPTTLTASFTMTPPTLARGCLGSGFAPVQVTCVRGDCDLPTDMYYGLQDGRVCFGQGVGLVAPQCTGAGCECDVRMTTDPTPATAAVYWGTHAEDCHGVKGLSGLSQVPPCVPG